jgi:hypothetical protein
VLFGAIITRGDNAAAKTLKNIRASSESLVVRQPLFSRAPIHSGGIV